MSESSSALIRALQPQWRESRQQLARWSAASWTGRTLSHLGLAMRQRPVRVLSLIGVGAVVGHMATAWSLGGVSSGWDLAARMGLALLGLCGWFSVLRRGA